MLLGVLKKKGDPNVLLDLPFTTDMLDKSMYQVPMRMGEFNGSNTPVITGGALFLPAGSGTYSAIATGLTNNSVFPHLDLKNKKYTIEFEAKTSSLYSYGVQVKMAIDLNSSNNAANGGTIGMYYRTSPNTSEGYVSNAGGAGILDAFGANPPTTFVKIKLVRDGATSYKLYLDDVLAQSATSGTEIMFRNTGDIAKGVIIAASQNAPCYIKNFRITANGTV